MAPFQTPKTHKIKTNNDSNLLWVNGSHFGCRKALLANSLGEITILVLKLQRPVDMSKKEERMR